MKKKIFTFLLALVASVGMSWADTYVTITQNDFPESGNSFTKDGVTVSVGSIDRWSGYLYWGGSFSTTLGNFTHIEVMAGDVEPLGEGWSGDDESQIWSGNASSVSFSGTISSLGQGITLLFTIEEPQLAVANTLQLHVNDALMGSVALQNPSNDIFDFGDGTYAVPEGATVTLIATPNEGYEFIGWKAGSVDCDFTDCGNALPTNDNPLTVDMYQEAAFMAEFAAVAPADNSVKLYHNFFGDWMETEAFGIYDDYTSEYAKISMILEPGDYQFALKVGGELRGDGTAFSRDKQACILAEGFTANLTLNVDVKGTYGFYWFYDENRFAMNVPNVCGMYWKDVTAGNFEVTLGQEGEVTLPKVWATNMGFAYNIFNGVDQVRLVSTDETVATIEYTLSMDGLGTITIHKAGECDIYAVHDITDYYCYDSCAFHLTVLPAPAPQPAEDVNITPNVDPDHAGVYYSTFFDSSVKYELPAGVEAYVADLSGANLLLTKIANAGQTIPANVAVILKSTVTPFTLSISDAEAVTFTATNDLQGTDVTAMYWLVRMA